MKKGSIVFIFFLILSVSQVCAERLVILDEKKDWSVAIAEFEITDSSADTIYLRKSLPSFFFNQLSSCKNHTLSDIERQKSKLKAVEKKIEIEEKNLSVLKKNYSLTYFNDKSKKRLLKEQIQESEKKIRQLEKYDIAKISVKPVKDISFITADKNSKVLTVDRLNIYRFAESNNFDYIIYGYIKQFSDVVFLEVNLYSLPENRDIFRTTLTSDINSLYSSLDTAVTELTSLLLGAPWSRLTVKTESRDADIYLNNNYIGSTIVDKMIVSPGVHTLAIKGQGVEKKEISIYLKESQENIISIEALETEEKYIAVNTLPNDADIYYDSLWRGRSPLLINGVSGEIFIRKEGYRDERLFLEDIKSNSLDFKLSPDIFEKEMYLEDRRNIFYRNMSVFVLSVPVSFFLFAVLNDYNDAYQNSISSGVNPDETERLRKLTNFSYYGYYSSLFLSVSLLVNTIFHLSDYIKAGDILAQEQ